MYNKRFSKSLSDQYDPQGKRLAAEIMKDMVSAELVEENTAEQSGDFSKGFWDQQFRLPNGKEIKVEPEIKDSKWYGEHWAKKTGFPFQYDTVDIPFRKSKCIADLHMVISSDEKLAFLVTRKAMDKHLEESGGKPKFKRTKYEPDGAYYFAPPLERGFFVKKENGHWRRWSE